MAKDKLMKVVSDACSMCVNSGGLCVSKNEVKYCIQKTPLGIFNTPPPPPPQHVETPSSFILYTILFTSIVITAGLLCDKFFPGKIYKLIQWIKTLGLRLVQMVQGWVHRHLPSKKSQGAHAETTATTENEEPRMGYQSVYPPPPMYTEILEPELARLQAEMC